MVEVFKTNVQQEAEAIRIVALLLHHFPGARVNFDLDDCDKILRVEDEEIITNKVAMLVCEKGYSCCAL